MTTLKKEDKIQIIEARLKSIEYKKYSLGIDLVVENNKSEPLEEAVINLNNAIEECNNQLEVLNSELADVNALAEQVKMEKLELIVNALQERIGQLVSGYETQIAVLRAELTELMNKQQEQAEYAKSLDAKIEEV